MIRALVLYYLSVKPTHGYEIQKFLQIMGVDAWTKIQSGSIYYALAKLEKEGCIMVLREERTGSRVRKIYEITDRGQKELIFDLKEEMKNPIVPAGSDKFLIQSMIEKIPRDTLETIVKQHIEVLKSQKDYWESWKTAKIGENSFRAEAISFEMTIVSLDYQILWHEEILEHLDQYINASIESRKIMEAIDFSNVKDNFSASVKANETSYVQNLKNEIISNPENAEENLNKLILELQKK